MLTCNGMWLDGDTTLMQLPSFFPYFVGCYGPGSLLRNLILLPQLMEDFAQLESLLFIEYGNYGNIIVNLLQI